MCKWSNVLKAIKLVLFTAGGGLAGGLFVLLIFLDENYTIPSIPKWGIILSVVSALTGAVMMGKLYYELLYKYETISSKKNT